MLNEEAVREVIRREMSLGEIGPRTSKGMLKRILPKYKEALLLI